MPLFCRQLPVRLAALVGQQAEKCRGPVPGVSTVVVPPALLLAEPAQSRTSLGLMLQEFGVDGEEPQSTIRPQTPAALALAQVPTWG